MPSYETLIRTAKQTLEAARLDISTEIHSYPTPISGCDAQFNHLIAEQQKIRNALAALDATIFVPTPRTPMQHSGVESR